MKRYLLPLALLLFLTGCTRVIVDTPLGTALTRAELTEFAGIWISENRTEHVITMAQGEHPLVITSTEADKKEVEVWHGLITTFVPSGPHILWLHDEKLSGYYPLRMAGGQGGAALMYPDLDTIKALADSGTISATYEKEKSAWFLSSKDLEPHLTSKQFWNIDALFIVHRKPADAAGHEGASKNVKAHAIDSP